MQRSREDGHDTRDPIIRLWIRLRDNDTCMICGRIYNPLLARIYPNKLRGIQIDQNYYYALIMSSANK